MMNLKPKVIKLKTTNSFVSLVLFAYSYAFGSVFKFGFKLKINP